jgi:hypothetical protein
MNAAILSVWCAARLLDSENVVEWMMSNFLLPEDKQMQHSKPHTVVTSAFSHIDVDHFVSNMGAEGLPIFTLHPVMRQSFSTRFCFQGRVLTRGYCDA